MKKFLFIAVLAMFLPFAGKAQDVDFDSPYFGARIAYNQMDPPSVGSNGVSVKLFNPGAGFSFGGVYHRPVYRKFYVEPGFNFYYNTYSLKKEYLSAIDGNLNGLSVRKFGFRIPVNAGLRVDFNEKVNLMIFTGPAIDVALSGRECAKQDGATVSVNGFKEDLNRFNFLWNLGFGFNFRRYYVGVECAWGTCNMYKGADPKQREDNYSITLGYNF